MKALIFAAVLALMVAAAQAAEPGKSHTLVRAMRSDEIAVASAKRAFLSGAVEQRFGKTQESCVKSSLSATSRRRLKVVDAVLSPQEIDTALQFFSRRPASNTWGLIRRLRTSQGEDCALPKVAGKEEITPEQWLRSPISRARTWPKDHGPRDDRIAHRPGVWRRHHGRHRCQVRWTVVPRSFACGGFAAWRYSPPS